MAKKRALVEAPVVQEWIDEHRGWSYAEGTITKEFKFKSFRDSIVFVNRVASIADDADHHPDMTIRYNRVTIGLTTHDSGGVTQLDLDIAKAIDFATSTR